MNAKNDKHFISPCHRDSVVVFPNPEPRTPNPEPRETTTLDMVPPGQHCRIVKVELRGPVRRRFMDMGLVTDATIEIVRMAPLGDPMELKIKGYLLSVRKEDARFITVEWTQDDHESQVSHHD